MTIVGGFGAPITGRAARETAAHAALTTAIAAADKARQQAEDASRAQETLTQELAAAQAEELRQDLTRRRNSLRAEAAAVADELTPLDEAFERTDAAHRDAQAEQRRLDERRAEVAAHLATSNTQPSTATNRRPRYHAPTVAGCAIGRQTRANNVRNGSTPNLRRAREIAVWWARAAARSWMAPGNAGEAHSSWPWLPDSTGTSI